jgi:hypothetical protein
VHNLEQAGFVMRKVIPWRNTVKEIAAQPATPSESEQRGPETFRESPGFAQLELSQDPYNGTRKIQST